MRGELQIGNVRLFLGDFRDYLGVLEQADVIVSDPPYGHGYKVNARPPRNGGLKGSSAWATEAQRPIEGFNQPFDVLPLINAKRVALFGANHFSALPVGGRWIVWDKRRDSRPDDHSDCELVWTNIPGADRIHRQKWRGICREGEENISRGGRKLHPNQKPVALIDFVFDQIGVQPGETVLDPCMGSGSTGVVALRRGNPFIGFEIDERHFDVAVARLSREAS